MPLLWQQLYRHLRRRQPLRCEQLCRSPSMSHGPAARRSTRSCARECSAARSSWRANRLHLFLLSYEARSKPESPHARVLSYEIYSPPDFSPYMTFCCLRRLLQRARPPAPSSCSSSPGCSTAPIVAGMSPAVPVPLGKAVIRLQCVRFRCCDGRQTVANSCPRSVPAHQLSRVNEGEGQWAGSLWGEAAGGGGGACVEVRADLYQEGAEGEFDVEAALQVTTSHVSQLAQPELLTRRNQAARAAISNVHARALAHVRCGHYAPSW
jgi:hypothetical protein